MKQIDLINLAITGIKTKQIALQNGIERNKGNNFVVEALKKALEATFPIRRELEEMKEAHEEAPDMFGWVNEALEGLTIRRV